MVHMVALSLGMRGKLCTTCADDLFSCRGEAVKTPPSSGKVETYRGGAPSVQVLKVLFLQIVESQPGLESPIYCLAVVQQRTHC